jgi:hemerythrin
MSDSLRVSSPAAPDGAHTMDAEHSIQLNLMRALAAAIDSDGDWQELFDQLAQFSRVHFLSEELLMRMYDYEDYDDHVQDHERMLGWLDEFLEADTDREARKRALQELTALFLRHVGGRDRRLHKHLDAV